MKISINYQTCYKFSTEVPRLVQQLKLFPTECSNQKIIDWSINATEGQIVESHIDALGHKIYNIYLNNVTDDQKIIAKGTVNTKNTYGVMKGLNEKVHPACFIRQTELTRPNKKIMNLVKDFEANSIVFCHKMNKAVGRSIKYLTGSTDIDTNAQKSVNLGTGVCQDFAHILIGLARYNNYPARYVNGFIANDSNIGSNDTHAWVEIFIKNLGWVGFDPSNNTCVDEKYVRFGCGYDFSDSSMIKGVKSNFKGLETLSKEIDIDVQTSQ